MRKIVIANWKMNPVDIREANKLFKETLEKASPGIQTIIAPPFIFLEELSRHKLPRFVSLGAQDVFWEKEGAFTGEISPQELSKLGIKYAIIGHSERRIHLGETDEMVSKKINVVIKNKIIPILCVGESAIERNSGLKEKVVLREIKIGLSLLDGGEEIIIAYEPIWAIGSGITDTPEDTLETFRFIRQALLESGKNFKVKLIYGGSINSKNINNFIHHTEIDGVLIGGASLRGNEIRKILNQI